MLTREASQVVLITGATDGLGKAAAILLAEKGYRVFAAGRSAEKRGQLDTMAREKNLPLETVELDVCDDASVTAAVNSVLERAGAIDVLLNNAGIAVAATVEELRMDGWRWLFETNVFGVIRLTQAVLPRMRARRRGRILMMSSVQGLITAPIYGPYSSTKHALEGLSNALRLEVRRFGIDVVLIEPGVIATGIQDVASTAMKPYAAQLETGPYADLYATVLPSIRQSVKDAKTTPEHCAQVILEIVQARKPKARYGVTPSATVARWGKRLLSDEALDGVLRRTFGIKEMDVK